MTINEGRGVMTIPRLGVKRASELPGYKQPAGSGTCRACRPSPSTARRFDCLPLQLRVTTVPSQEGVGQ
jgi:hypothetical protein